MINSFKLSNEKPTSYTWAEDIPFLANEITFKPGLNIIFGPNASGKSTLIDIMASYLFAKQSGRSVITSSALGDLYSDSLVGNKVAVLPAEILHDGQPIIYVDPRQEVGLINGHFDDDFMTDGINSLRSRNQSTGQKTSMRINEAIDILMRTNLFNAKKDKKAPKVNEFPTEFVWKMTKSQVNDFWAARLDFAESMLKSTIPVGQKTILMDEPESGFSLVWQYGLWSNVLASEEASKFQLIIATHSPYALNVPNANYIDVVPGYREQCLNELRAALL